MEKLLVHLCLLVCGVCQIHAILKYCLPKASAGNSRTLKHACEKVYTGQEIQCVITEDRLNCLMLVNNGEADFTIAEPEDLRLLHNYKESNVLVTHQLMKFSERSPQMNIEMIAIVKSDFNNSWTTKGKKLCYLGLETGSTPQYGYYYTPYFESWLFRMSCDPKRTMLENRVAGLAGHFDSACIAGPWSLDKKIDTELKRKYANLCALCADPKDCDEDDRYYGLNGALSCLRQGFGDIAWTSKSDASKYFADLSSMGYSLLCPGGTFASLTGRDEDICTWVVDPQPVIIAHKQVAEFVLEKIIDKGKDRAYFYQVIHSPYKFSYLKKLEKPKNVLDYLESFPGFLSYSIKLQTCRWTHTIRWCISTDLEEKKCRFLKMASEALRLKPAFSCVRMQSRSAIVKNMDNGKCDVFAVKSTGAHEVHGIGLKPVIDMLPNKRDDLNTIAAVVRRNSRFNSYEDLKGATACFAGYRSVGWSAFYSTLKSNCSVSEPSDVNVISSYFSQTCVLGIDPNNRTFPKNLHSLCKDTNLTLGTEERTFKCLEDGADVAFVNVSAARQYSIPHAVFSATYKILCSKVQNTSCFLTKATLGSILVHENITKVREDEVYLMFLALDRYFGRMHDRETAMFNMYGAFEGHSDVLFPAATMTLRRSVASEITDKTGRSIEACEDIYGKPHNHGRRAEFFLNFCASLLLYTFICNELR